MTHIRKQLLSLFLFALPALSFATQPRLTVKAVNELSFGRLNQTITLSAAQLKPLGDVELEKIHVQTAAGRELLVQAVDSDGDHRPDEVIFQTDFRPNQTRYFVVHVGKPHLYRADQYKAYGRFVRERFGDFAWENDRIIQRTYGQRLQTWQRGALTSSAVDVWVKSTPELVINDWYMTDHYHINTGQGADLYTAGTSRGVGGDGLWAGGRLWVSENHVDSRVLANGPIRVMFKLMYAPFNVNGTHVRETRRIALDAGQNLNHYKITYRPEKPMELVAAIGIQKPNLTPKEAGGRISPDSGSQPSKRLPGAFTKGDINDEEGWVTAQQLLSEGRLNAAIIVDPDQFIKVTENKQNLLVLAKVPENNVISYWVGYSWSKSDRFKSYQAWKTYIDHFAQGIRSPIQVTVSSDKIIPKK